LPSAEAEKIDRKSLRIYKAKLRFAHDKFSNLEMDMLFYLNQLPAGKAIEWPAFNMLLINRIIAAGYVVMGRANSGIVASAGGASMRLTPDLVVITPKGREFLRDLGLAE
jgi:hypothetical protein